MIAWDTLDSSSNKRLLRDLAAENMPVHRVSDIIPDFDKHEDRYLIERDGHPTPLAHRVIAEYAAREILGDSKDR